MRERPPPTRPPPTQPPSAQLPRTQPPGRPPQRTPPPRPQPRATQPPGTRAPRTFPAAGLPLGAQQRRPIQIEQLDGDRSDWPRPAAILAGQRFKSPRQLNGVTVSLLVGFGVAAYLLLQFGPVYYQAASVRAILGNAASRLYQTSRMAAGPMRDREDGRLKMDAEGEIRKAGVDDPKLMLGIDRTNPGMVVVYAGYTAVVCHPVLGIRTRVQFYREATTDLSRRPPH